MENATKALLIAAGMLLAVMIISLLVMGYNQISAHYSQQTELLTAEQLDKFNKQFQNYNRENIRGNELISLMNKIIDYNTSQSYQVGTGYKPIKVSIKLTDDSGNSLLDSFKYETNSAPATSQGGILSSAIIENTVSNVNNQANDKKLIAITDVPNNLISNAPTRN